MLIVSLMENYYNQSIKSCFFFLVLLLLTFNCDVGESSAVDETRCEWTELIEPVKEQHYDYETSGYPISSFRASVEFCAAPTEIECFDAATGQQLSHGEDIICTVEKGISCLFCATYKARFKCCYTPPDPIGESFQLRSMTNEQCLASNLVEDGAVEMRGCGDDDMRERWVWCEDERIMDQHNKQCLHFNSTTQLLNTINCDRPEISRWEPEGNALLHQTSKQYLDSSRIKLNTRARRSRWQAVVAAGRGFPASMQSFPCTDPPSAPLHGELSCSFGSYLGSECRFACASGYRLGESDVSVTTCRKSGRFGDEPPTCHRMTCEPMMTSVDEGNVTCSDSNYHGSTCSVTCRLGYRVDVDEGDSSDVRCGDEGWNRQLPSCRRIECPAPTASSSSTMNCTDGNFFSSTCTYTCDKGYTMQGSPTATCLASSQWTHPPPTCTKIRCNVMKSPVNGVMTCTSEQLELGSTCKFACEEGYTMMGSSSVTCTHTQLWSSTPPTCKRKTCNELSAPDHGVVRCSDSNMYASVCSFSCEEGYRLVGVDGDQLTCSNGGWDKGAPTCQAQKCERVGSLLDGQRLCSDDDHLYGSTCTFKCNTGFKLRGDKRITCLSTGWSTPPPVCEDELCYPVLGRIEHGRWECLNSNKYQSQCKLYCDGGYQASVLDANTDRWCKVGGSWTGRNVTCQRKVCPQLKPLTNGAVRCSDGLNDGSVCTYTCNRGYNPIGATTSTCSDSKWDSFQPFCNEVTCHPKLIAPSNGDIECSKGGSSTQAGLTCVYSCKEGYLLTGVRVATCKLDQEWDFDYLNPATCSPVKCPALSSPSNGRVSCSADNLFQSTCTYSCDEGYQLDGGGEQLVCTKHKTWNHQPPSCRRISCQAVEQVRKGRVHCTDDNFYGSSCRVTCHVGYRLVPNSAPPRTCELDGRWSRHNSSWPYCEQFNCHLSYSNPSNGEVSCTDRNTYASVCTFACAKGFRLSGGPNTSTCTMRGWSAKTIPFCTKIECGEEVVRSEQLVESCTEGSEHQSLCSYRCVDGFQLRGSPTRMCMSDATWNNPLPTCAEIRCRDMDGSSLFSGGNIKCSDSNNYLSTCQLHCHPNFKLNKSPPHVEPITCQNDGTWSNTEHYKCVPVIETTTETPTTTPSTIEETTNDSDTSTRQAEPLTSHADNSTLVAAAGDDILDGASDERKSNSGNGERAPPGEGGVPTVTIVIISLVAILLVIVTAVFTWKCKMRRRKKSYHHHHHHRGAGGISSVDYYPSISGRGGMGGEEHQELRHLITTTTTSSNHHHRHHSPHYNSISVEKLELEFNRRHADDDKLLREEFAYLPDGKGSREQGEKIQNKNKNRYTNIIPYDHSRVVLPKSANANDTDYINASFVDGYKHKGKFISAQGPKENTVNDFWRMIWDQNVSTIIMVTNLVEGKEIKCAQYWPSSGSETYGEVGVSLVCENHLVDYTIRTFTLHQTHASDPQLNMRRTLMQYHFTSWPDFGVPKSPSGMLKFMRRIKQYNPPGYGAIVVHCSAGVGRTGTYICIDAMVDMMVRENKIDVYNFVSQLRTQRPEMVQTEQQYIFIYQALLENHLYGDTEIEASEFAAHVEELSQKMPGNITGMEHEFKKLTNIRIQKDQMRVGNHPSNMRKNRILLILPYDWNRVIIPYMPGVENSDYINASYIDGYREKDTYIATQGPLHHTVHDFWRMVWDTQCASIVMLTQLVENNQVKCEQYWPESGVMQFGNLLVDRGDVTHNENYVTRDFVISSSQDLSGRRQFVRQFHYLKWPTTASGSTSDDLTNAHCGYSMIELVDQVQKQQQASGNHPILIHCSAGAGRTGLFCALSTALEQVKAEAVVDVFQIVKTLRMQRPHMVQTLDQYEFCYRAVGEYIDSMCEYCNFK